MEVRIERNLRSYRVKQKLATWVEEYGTGSGPGSPDGQPGWGGGSDRLQPATCTCNAQCLLACVEYEWKFVLNGTSGRYRSRF
jgi:hypothetical protein